MASARQDSSQLRPGQPARGPFTAKHPGKVSTLTPTGSPLDVTQSGNTPHTGHFMVFMAFEIVIYHPIPASSHSHHPPPPPFPPPPIAPDFCLFLLPVSIPHCPFRSNESRSLVRYCLIVNQQVWFAAISLSVSTRVLLSVGLPSIEHYTENA